MMLFNQVSLVRDSSHDTFGRQICQFAESNSDPDVIFECSDGKIASHKLILATMSPLLYTIFTNQDKDEDLVTCILLPDHSVADIQWIQTLLTTKQMQTSQIQEENVNSVFKTLDFSKLFDKTPVKECNTVMNDSVYYGEPKILTNFYKNIPELPDIESTELFDPMYLEDIEIENEENLSLTIHSSELISTISKKPKCKLKTSPGFKCKKCSAEFKSCEKKAAHMKTEHEKDAVACPECNKKFKSKGRLEKHSTINHVKKQLDFNCQQCDKQFKTENQQKQHIEKSHLDTGQRKHTCQHCQKRFKKMFQLQNHLRIHSGDKPFICHSCGKAFNQEGTLRMHMRIHSGIKLHKCDECDESFIASNTLLAHKQWKHSGGLRPFICSFCSKSFPTKAAVRKHETIHKAEKKYECEICGNKYARGDHLKSHMKSHKNQINKTLAEEEKKNLEFKIIIKSEQSN